jgi:hypothetical protein
MRLPLQRTDHPKLHITMPRTESKSIQVHPNDEQSMIEFMQKFGWNLLSTQEIKTKDSHLEQRGDSIYSVTESEHYVKLAFSRDLDMPHLKEIKEIENEYLNLPNPPPVPKVFPMWALAVTVLTCGAGLLVWLIYYLAFYKPKKQAADRLADQRTAKRKEVLDRVAQYI